MKRNIITRSIALMLILVLLIPFMPVRAQAHYEVPIYWTEELYKLDGYSGYIYEFEQVQKDICGFYLGYCLTEIEKGNLNGDFNIEVCVHDTSGNWFVAEMFTYDTLGEEIRELVAWDDPRDIDKFTLILRKQGLVGYQWLYVANPIIASDPWQERIPCHVSDEQFKKSGKTTYPYVLEETLNDCQGFTLHYEMDEITKGALTCNTKYEVYVRPHAGSWKKVNTFTMRGDEAIVDVSWNEKIDVDEIAILCQHNKAFSYVANAAFSDAVYEPVEYSYESYDTDNDVSVNGQYLSGSWSDTLFKRNGRQSYPFVLDNSLKKCKGFTLDYSVSNVTKGTMKEDSKFMVYYKTADGTWNKGPEFTLDDGFASVNVKLKKAATVTQVAVHCMNAGYFSYQYSLGVRDPVY